MRNWKIHHVGVTANVYIDKLDRKRSWTERGKGRDDMAAH
jgi:hypothetical protein